MKKQIKVGIVGARGLCNILGLQAIDGVTVEALCDLDQDLLNEQCTKHNIPKQYRIYEDMLQSDIDAVIVATPMQFHVMHVISALQAGKHVMCEVTAGVTMDELWWLVEEVEKSNKVYMFAENYCYSPQMQIVKNMALDGVFGDIYFAEGEYLHNIGDILTYKNGNASWRQYWQVGKRGCFYPTHSLGPIMKCFHNGERIKSVSSFGTGSWSNKAFRQDDSSLTICTLENDKAGHSEKMVKIRVDCMSNRPHKMDYYSIQGTKGCYEAPRGFGDDHKVYIDGMPKDGSNPLWQGLSQFEELYLPQRYKTASDEAKKAGHNGGDFFIVEDFINAIVNNEKPTIDVYDACEWTAVGLLSELSVTNGGRAIDMPNFRKRSYKDMSIKL